MPPYSEAEVMPSTAEENGPVLGLPTKLLVDTTPSTSFSSESSTSRDRPNSENLGERRMAARPRRCRVQSMNAGSRGAQDFFGAPPVRDASANHGDRRVSARPRRPGVSQSMNAGSTCALNFFDTPDGDDSAKLKPEKLDSKVVSECQDEEGGQDEEEEDIEETVASVESKEVVVTPQSQLDPARSAGKENVKSPIVKSPPSPDLNSGRKVKADTGCQCIIL